MKAPRVIPPDVQEQQIAASDPDVSAFVAANAGSGKTHVLAQRVIRLLLTGVDPAKILCITFTKAAAANMAMRVFKTLSEWTAFDDHTLDAAIKITGGEPGPDVRARARQLFALALETPGGLKVQTIHAFCTRLLQQFPFEADVAARFTVLDETSERQMLDQLSLAVLLEGAGRPEGALGRALEKAIAAAADQTFREVVNEAIGKRDAVSQWIEKAGSVDAAIDELSRTLGLDPADTRENVGAEIVDGPNLPSAQWAAIAAICNASSSNDKKQCERLSLAAGATGSLRIDAYLSVFFTDKFELRQSPITDALGLKHPDLAVRLAAEQQRLLFLIDRRRAIACRDRSAALITIAAAVITRYRAEKNRRGLLDYDDLIDRTLGLFQKTSAAWVLYKLDLGIDHVLIDEAQDTSPKQWDIIKTLVSEFTAGAGARAMKRTIFAVGDEKQSIFSFQGAAPLKFTEIRLELERAFTAIEQEWRFLRFQSSFRSGTILLGAVDAVFARPEAHAGLTADPVKTVHRALPDAVPGMVDIWPLIEPEDKREIEGWDAPFDTLTETSPPVRLAKKIARNVSLWQKAGARPGDILVLVRQRGPLFEAIIRALKNERIDVAGADRLVLTEHIAVMDLIALADALLLPQDDLALATILKGPLFGLSEDDLFAIAWKRGKKTLRAALDSKASEDDRFAQAAAQLEMLSDAAQRRSPFAFYAGLLGPGQGRKRMLARLGPEAADALDEFINLALDYERRGTPSLQGFVAWLRGARAEIKRDMEMARDEVRVMTVHGAKGLEAPIVVLADTTTMPAGPRDPRLLMLPATAAVPGTPARLAWATARKQDVEPLRLAREAARQAAQDEYRRLLYVAMTRASERLVVCGAVSARGRPEGCWYDLVHAALQPLASEIGAEDSEGNLWRYQKTVPAPLAARAGAKSSRDESPIVLPGWLHHDAPAEPRSAVPTIPSRYAEDEISHPATARMLADRDTSLARGRLVHRLLQSLPDLLPERRPEAARRHLARTGAAFSESERDEMLVQVLKVIGDPRFGPLFAPGSHAEVLIVGRLAGGKQGLLAVSGQVDRLAVTDKEVLIADYKTDRPAPRRLDDVPPEYRRQLALYRAVLGRIYPGRLIRAALIWTDLPELMEIPADRLDAELAPPAAA